MNKQVRTLLEHADPARGVVVGPGDANAVLRRAATDITPFEAVPPRRSTRRAVLAVAVATAAAAGALALPRSPALGPMAGPSPVPGSSDAATNCLAALANHIAPTPYDGGSGRYEYLHNRSMSGFTSEVPGKTTFATATWQVEVKLWSAGDGSGRRIADRGPVQYPDEASRKFFATHTDALGTAHDDRTFATGERKPRPLPEAEPAAMAEQLYQPRENGPSAALVGVADLNAARILDAPHRAAVLRFLAATDGVTCAGETQTEVGAGLLVTAQLGQGPHPSPGDNGSEALLFDTSTGELIAAGTRPGQWTTVYLDRGYTEQTG
ncbi:MULTISPECIES: hypothetical protein [Micromonospora]|uniref:hypothetical protein n=1 Tax=Micromonospora TaxID=1873 RepID=UPI001B371B49|nr:hypothetical protein [Micromonospora sp. C81]MBQ1040816.1 hypothetical protein [Micromonospora sp. C81]WTI22278.1 hypothetical protein OG886_04015 [Micromonospora zamorensis]